MRRGYNLGVAVALTVMVLATVACSQPLQSAPSSSAQPPAESVAACDSPHLNVRNYAVYAEPADTLWVIGDVQNTSSEDLLLAALCITVSAGDSARVVRRFVGPMLLKAGERAPFRALLQNTPSAAMPDIRFSAEAQPASKYPTLASKVQRNFSIGNLVPTMRLDTNQVEVTGVLTNTGVWPVKSIYLAIGLYTNSGIVVGVAEQNVRDMDPLKPGDAVPFKMVVSHLVSPTAELKLRAIAEGQLADEAAMSGSDEPDTLSSDK